VPDNSAWNGSPKATSARVHKNGCELSHLTALDMSCLDNKPLCLEHCSGYFDQLAHVPRSPVRQAIKVDPSVYDAYLGQYEVVRNLIVTVTREETKLLAQATGYSKIEFFPESEIEFFAKGLDAQIMFVADYSGKITYARITLNGLEMQARKIN
jgi:hypothetical protein